MTIFSLSSRFHRIVGVGLPEALHVSVTLAFSLTMASEELCESSIFGGTRKIKFITIFQYHVENKFHYYYEMKFREKKNYHQFNNIL